MTALRWAFAAAALALSIGAGQAQEGSDYTAVSGSLTFTAGHYDEANLVWSFSGEVTGIFGLTQSTSPEQPAD